MNQRVLPRPALLGGLPPWPLAGYLRGQLRGDDVVLCWAGRIAHREPPEIGWRASRQLERALKSGGALIGGRRRALAVAWSRLDGAPAEHLGPSGGGDLTLLLLAIDRDGVALSGVGLHTIYAADQGELRPWVQAPHPLLGAPGRPRERPGALTVDQAPPWVIATTEGAPSLSGVALDEVLPHCGVHL